MKKESEKLSKEEKALLAEWSRFVCDVIVIKAEGE